VDLQALANGGKRLPLALLGALAVTHVQGRGLVIARGQRRTDARIHSSTEEDHGAGWGPLVDQTLPAWKKPTLTCVPGIAANRPRLSQKHS